MSLIDADALKKHKFTVQIRNGVAIEEIEVVSVASIENASPEPQVTVFAENASKEEIEDFKQELENVLARPQGELANEVWELYEKYQPHLATRVIEFGDELKELLGKYQEGGKEE